MSGHGIALTEYQLTENNESTKAICESVWNMISQIVVVRDMKRSEAYSFLAGPTTLGMVRSDKNLDFYLNTNHFENKHEEEENIISHFLYEKSIDMMDSLYATSINDYHDFILWKETTANPDLKKKADIIKSMK